MFPMRVIIVLILFSSTLYLNPQLHKESCTGFDDDS